MTFVTGDTSDYAFAAFGVTDSWAIRTTALGLLTGGIWLRSRAAPCEPLAMEHAANWAGRLPLPQRLPAPLSRTGLAIIALARWIYWALVALLVALACLGIIFFAVNAWRERFYPLPVLLAASGLYCFWRWRRAET